MESDTVPPLVSGAVPLITKPIVLPKAPHAHCDVCPLVKEKHVNGAGPERASLVVVGEAPGAGEVASGIPFTGASGQLLDKVLKHHGFDRNRIYVTNTVLCRPPGNRTPTSTEVRACFDRLVAELKDKEPEAILTLGNTATQTLLDSRTGITSLRTEVDARSPYLPGVRIVPTFHTAAALRSPDLFPSIVTDVKKLTRVEVVWEHTKYKVPETLPEALVTLEAQKEQAASIGGLITCDVELDIDDMRRFDTKNPQWLCIGISSRAGAAVVYPQEVLTPQFFNQLNNAFLDKRLRWGWQNGKFDIQELWGDGVPNARVDEDSMLLHYATDERKGTHDLEQLGVEKLGSPRWKAEAHKYLPRKGASLRYLPRDILHQYNAGDTDVTYRLIDPLTKEVESDGVSRPYRELLIPGSNALARAEFIGAKVDRGRLDELHASLSGELQGLEEVLHRWVDNPRSPPQVKRSFARLGIGGDGGPTTTNKEFLKSVIEGPSYAKEAKEFAGQLLDHRQRSKLLSTYVVGLGRSLVRGRVHPTFLLHGTETGRLSCRRPNLQNVPSGSTIRDAFIAGPDNVLLNADYSQIEFRLAAILSGDEWLLDQFRKGREFHKEVARRFFGETWTDLQYLRAKAVNFGLLYGRQAPSLAAEWKIPGAEAQRMVREFFQTMPKVKEYQKDLERQIKERGYLESYFERKRRFWLVTRQNWEAIKKEGYNFPLQSTASDFTLQSLIRLEPILRGKAAPVITVHDNLIFEVRRQYLEEVAYIVKEVMEDTGVQDICPTPVDIRVGMRWGDHKERPCPTPPCDHLQTWEVA